MTRLPVLCVCAALAMTASGADRTLLAISGDTEVVIGVKADRAFDSGLGRTALRDLGFAHGRWEKILQAAGLDVKRDIREIVIAANHASRSDALVAARGAFDRERIRAAAIGGGLTRHAYNGIDVFAHPAVERDVQWFAVAAADVALLGPAARVREAIDRWKQAAAPSASLLERVRSVESGDLWLVSRAPIAILAAVAPDRNTAAAARGDLFRSIEQWDASIRLGSMVRVDGHAWARSANDAASITEAMNFLMGLLQMQGGAGAGLAGAIKGFQAASTGSRVTVSFQVPEATLQSALTRSLPRLPEKEKL